MCLFAVFVESDRAVEAAHEALCANNEGVSDLNNDPDHDDSCDSHSLESWKDDNPGEVDGQSVERGRDQSSAPPMERASEPAHETMETTGNRISWADMAQEEDGILGEEVKANRLSNGNHLKAEVEPPKPELSRELRERIHFNNVTRKKDFICLERVDGKLLIYLRASNSTRVFSAPPNKNGLLSMYINFRKWEGMDNCEVCSYFLSISLIFCELIFFLIHIETKCWHLFILICIKTKK